MYTPKESKAETRTGIRTPVFLTALLTTAKRRKQQVAIKDEWVNKLWSLLAMGYYSALKRRESLTQASTRMNLEDAMLSEISQSQQDKDPLI